jgi:F-type H+-transporting ATPase subunit b
MPQLDLSTFPSQVFWLFVTFTVLYALMAMLITPRIERIVTARQSRVDGALAQASRLQAEAEAIMAAYEKAIADARMQAQATVKATLDRLNQVASERQGQANAQIARRLEEAERRIAAEKNQALASLPQMAAEVAESAIARLAGRASAGGAVAAAVESVIKERV